GRIGALVTRPRKGAIAPVEGALSLDAVISVHHGRVCATPSLIRPLARARGEMVTQPPKARAAASARARRIDFIGSPWRERSPATWRRSRLYANVGTGSARCAPISFSSFGSGWLAVIVHHLAMLHYH